MIWSIDEPVGIVSARIGTDGMGPIGVVVGAVVRTNGAGGSCSVGRAEWDAPWNCSECGA